MISAVMHLMIEKMAEDGRVSADEVLQLRRTIFPDGAVCRAEAEMLFLLNERVSDDDQEWNVCFVEAICDHLLQSQDPKGHVSEEGAAWLEQRICRDGVLEGPTELELVLKLMETAQSCPARLHDAARKYVTRAILSGQGYYGRDLALVSGQIGETELAMIRRLLFAASGDGRVAVTRAEAEWLFEIDAATEGRAHVSGWRDLFVSAIMNHLFAAGSSSLLDRDSMLHRAQWLETPHTGGLGSFFSRLVAGGPEGYKQNVLQANPRDAMNAHMAQREVEAHMAEALDAAEAAWLVTRIRADGRRTANENALMDAVKAMKGDDALKSA